MNLNRQQAAALAEAGTSISDIAALAETPPSEGWQTQALCRGAVATFFPERGEPTTIAKAACRMCPVRLTCLGVAFAGSEKFGVWGGLTERQRRSIRRLVNAELQLRREAPAIAS